MRWRLAFDAGAAGSTLVVALAALSGCVQIERAEIAPGMPTIWISLHATGACRLHPCDATLAAERLRELIAEVQLATAPDHRPPLCIARPRDQALLLNGGT